MRAHLASLLLAPAVVVALQDQQFFQEDSILAGPYGLNNAHCKQDFYTIDVKSTNVKFINLDQTDQNQTVVTSLVHLFTLSQPTFTQGFIDGSFQFSATYNISGTLCAPIDGAKADAAIQVLVHGGAGDSTYWDFGLSPEYSYVKHAASHGYSTFRYDRLGCGLTETPVNGYDEVQAPTEVAILKAFIELLRHTETIGGRSWKKVVGIGHSLGSVEIQAITLRYPELYDAVVLQGFTANASFLSNTYQAQGWTIANTVPDLPHLAKYPPAWLATASLVTNQMPFWVWPFYPEAARGLSREHEYPVTLGILFTLPMVGGVAHRYTKPVQFVIGDKDFVFAGGNSYAGPNGLSIPEASAAQLYPNAEPEIHIVPNTGHLMTQHYSAPRVHEVTLDFIARHHL